MRHNENSALTIKRAFIDALENGNRSMTVSQLCRLSGVARATFYLHFKSIDDVFIAIIDDIFSDLEDLQNAQTAIDAEPGTDSAYKEHATAQVEATLKYRSILLALIDLGMLDAITRRARDTVRRSVYLANPNLREFAGSDEFEDSLSFVVGGCGLLMETWLRSSTESSPEPRLMSQLVKMITESLTAGTRETCIA